MHYIRFLKPPRLVQATHPGGADTVELRAKITITTDLGESFLFTDVELSVALDFSAKGDSRIQDAGKYTWKSGMRSLEVVVPLAQIPSRSRETGKRRKTGQEGSQRIQVQCWPCRLLVRPSDPKICIDSRDKVLSAANAGIVPVWSEEMDGSLNQKPSQRVLRRLSLTKDKEIKIWEETGESIERHIWDAGLVLSAYLSSLVESTSPTNLDQMPQLTKVLSKPSLRVLELGAGCGIVGITLGASLESTEVLLTDLAAAEEILEENILENFPIKDKTASSRVLDWSTSPEDVSKASWDLILVADCTYNADVVPDLVKTLRAVVPRTSVPGDEILVLLAMKVRHESEKIFFDLMEEAGFYTSETINIPLGILGSDEEDSEEIKIFGFLSHQ